MAKTYEVKIGSTALTGLKSYIVSRPKLFSEAERTLNGDLKATFIGVFPKITLRFNYLTETQLKAILILLEPASISVQWWDSHSASYKTGTFYAGDFAYPLWRNDVSMYEPFEVNLISYSKI
jgi:hypothetical protein